MTDVDEQWREVPSAPEYQISSYGRVRRVLGGQGARPMLRKQDLEHTGYRRVRLFSGGQRQRLSVHRLVAMAFLGEAPSSQHQVAHNDGNRQNNRLDNLRWATPAENLADRERHGTELRGGRNGRAKLTAEDAAAIRASPASDRALGRQFGVSGTQINRIRKGESWVHLNPSAANQS